MTNVKLLEFPNLEKLSIAAVEYFVDLHKPPNKQTFLVPGGQTPKLFYKLLARTVDDWSGTTLLLSDERLVPQGNAMSNAGMVKKQIINNFNAVTPPNIIEFVNRSRFIDPEQILKSVNNYAKTLFPLTAAFLGIGADGHTASLFPGFEQCFYNHPDSFIKVNKSNEPFSRISISANVLIDTPQIFFLVSGSDKKAVMKKILKKPAEMDTLPVQNILNKSNGKFVFLCDSEALAF